MYRLNKTARNVLITPDEVIFHAPTSGSEGERQVLNNIIVAEERWISEVLGFDFYEKLCDLKNKEVTEENRDELFNLLVDDYAKDDIVFSEKDLKVGDIVNALEFIDDEWVKKLWRQYLWKITAECVDQMGIVSSWLKTTASGQQMENPKSIGAFEQKSASGDRKDIQFKMDNAMFERIQPLIERMKQWLCKNRVHFSYYKADCDQYENKTTSNLGFSIGHYDEPRKSCL